MVVLNNIVEQDHRAVQRVTRPLLEFQSFEAAQSTLAGIELIEVVAHRRWTDLANTAFYLSNDTSVLRCLKLVTSSGATAPS